MFPLHEFATRDNENPCALPISNSSAYVMYPICPFLPNIWVPCSPQNVSSSYLQPFIYDDSQ